MNRLRNRLAAIAVCLALDGCIPSPSIDRGPPAPPPRDDAALRQCLSDLGVQRVRYTSLPDRQFGGGCSAVGTVQLLDIGTPVTNLGPMTCGLARTFAGWVRGTVQPAARRWLGSSVARIESFGTYGCRSVNGQPGARLSEHGKSNAVDVAVFVLADGRRISVKDGWKGREEDVRRFLRELHDEGCRRFTITLGPDADAFHRDHLHFDMGRGPYCR
jgi:hypothetical protein